MLRVDDRKGFELLFPTLVRGPEQIQKPVILQRPEPAPAVPLIARDTYVAETSSQIEALQATLRLLSRDVNRLTDKMGEIERTADQDHRWLAFERSEKKAKQVKLEDVVRSCRELKARLDRIEANNRGNYHAYHSFEAVSRKLGELDDFRAEAKRAERTVVWRARLLCGLIAASFLIVMLSGFFPN